MILPPLPDGLIEAVSTFLSAMIADATGVALISFGTLVTGASFVGLAGSGFWFPVSGFGFGVSSLGASSFGVISRNASASTASGYYKVHAQEQAEIIETAFNI